MRQGRRDFLKGAGAAALGAAWPAAAAAQPVKPPGSYSGLRELRAALDGRQVSAFELANAAIARMEALDGRLTAVVVRDCGRAGAAAKEAEAAGARSKSRT